MPVLGDPTVLAMVFVLFVKFFVVFVAIEVQCIRPGMFVRRPFVRHRFVLHPFDLRRFVLHPVLHPALHPDISTR